MPCHPPNITETFWKQPTYPLYLQNENYLINKLYFCLGLSLSQAARKHDIPYPTFVLYANRVHNMLGPSITNGNHTVGAGNMNLGKSKSNYLENNFLKILSKWTK